MAITNWPLDDRPREKLLNKGADTLSDAELVAIFLRTGVRGKSAVDVAREALARFGSLSGLFAAGADALTAVSGLGAAKYVQLQAVLEMARRTLREKLDRGSALSSPQAVERLNGTQRVFLKRLNRLTLCFSKKLRNLEAAFAMFAAYYNYCWQTRKPGKSGQKRPTAAMMAGIGRARLVV